MNASIGRLFGLVLVLFALLVGFTSRWTVFEAEALRDNDNNRRELLAEQLIKRGVIRADNGQVLARSPALCDISLRIVICDGSPYRLWICRTSGTNLTTGSSRVRRPRSRSCMIAMPVKVLVIDAQW